MPFLRRSGQWSGAWNVLHKGHSRPMTLAQLWHGIVVLCPSRRQMSQGNGGGFGGFGIRPPQSETRTAGIPVDLKLVLLQGLWLGIVGDIGALTGVLVVFVGRALTHWHGFWPWFSLAWRWPAMFMVLWWLVPCSVVGWRFFVEIVDPSYPTPRISIPPEDQPLGPIMPWHREHWEPAKQEPVSQQAQRTVRVEVNSENGQQQRIAFLPDAPEVRTFARMAANGQSFSERTAIKRAKMSLDDWKQTRGAFQERGWATWKDPREKRQGLELTHVGRAVLRYVAGTQ
jgi:hypothetical protein